MNKVIPASLILLLIFMGSTQLNAQHSVMFNLDIPFQYYTGYNYTASEKINVEGGIGLVVPPFNKWVFTVLPIPVDKDPNRDFARESADWGYIFNVGGNYELGKDWFAGIFGEYAVLKGSTNLVEVAESEFQGDVEDILDENGIDPALLPVITSLSKDKAEFESKIFQIGLQFGRTFQFKNPKLKLKTSLALSRTLSSQTTLTSYTYEDIPLIPNSDQIYQLVEDEMKVILETETDDVFLDYGYITTLRIGLFYNLSNNK